MKPQRYGIAGDPTPKPGEVVTPQPDLCPPPVAQWEDTRQPEPDIRKTLTPDKLDI